MTVKVDICNSALLKLGQERIGSLNDDNKRARECSHAIDTVIGFVLRDAFWNFAIQRETLAVSGDAFSWGTEAIYNLPQDCVRVMRVMYDDYYQPKYKIEGRKLVVGAPSSADGVTQPLRLAYIRNSMPESFFDHKFKEAVATKLAAELSYSMTQSSALKQALLGEYTAYLADGKSINSQEVSPDDFKFDYFDNARRVGHEVYNDADFG